MTPLHGGGRFFYAAMRPRSLPFVLSLILLFGGPVGAAAGAILGRAASAQRHLLAAYGRDLGAAFQIADDLLDATGTTAETGKTAGKDEAAGKATLVSVLGVERARAQAEALATQAARHLESFGAKADLLRELAGYVVSRRN